MYNSLFWSISPQDAVTQGGFLVDIVDDDILGLSVLTPLIVKWEGGGLARQYLSNSLVTAL